MPSQTSRLFSTSLLPCTKLLLLSTKQSLLSRELTTLPSPPIPRLSPPPFSPAAAAAQDPPPKSHFMVDYLVFRCGFSPSEAPKISARLPSVKSIEKPDSVLRFLHLLGLDPSVVKSLVAKSPRILVADVDKTLKPKIEAVRKIGFSESDIAELLAASPSILLINTILPKIEFLRARLSSKPDLLKALTRDRSLLQCNLDTSLVPNTLLLRQHGVPESRIAYAIREMPWLLTRRADHFQKLVDRIKSLGFPCHSPAFTSALYAMSRTSKETTQINIELMKSFGWSEADFYMAFRKFPNFLASSSGKLRTAMAFLVGEAGLEPRYIAEKPILLKFSMEKRVVPRHRVHQILKSEGLPGAKAKLLSLLNLRESKFVERYVAPHVDRVPVLREYYARACAEGLPV